MGVIAFVDFRDFEVALLRRADPGLERRPVVVVRGVAGRGVVAACSREARRAGVRIGMAATMARRLCPGACFGSGRDLESGESFSREFFGFLGSFSPVVEPAGAAAGWLDLGGMGRLFGSPLEAGAGILAKAGERFGLEGVVGIAGHKLVARAAAEVAGGGNVLWILPGRESQFLRELPVSVLPGVGERLAGRLLALGVRRVGDLCRVGRDLLVAAFGRKGEELYRAASLAPEPLRPAGRPVAVGSADVLLGTLAREVLEAYLYHLAGRLAAEVRSSGLAVHRLDFEAMYEDASLWRDTARFRRPVSFDRDLYDGARRVLGRALRRRVRIVRLKLSLGDPAPHIVQGDLWFDSEERLWRLYRAVDRVRLRFGFESLTSGKVAGWRVR